MSALPRLGFLGLGWIGQHRLHPMLADPAEAQETEPGKGSGCRHVVTSAFMKPSGRVRVSSSASPSRSSGSLWV